MKRRLALRVVVSIAFAAAVASFFGSGSTSSPGPNYPAGAETRGQPVTTYFTYCVDFACYPTWPVNWRVWGSTWGSTYPPPSNEVYYEQGVQDGVYVIGLMNLPFKDIFAFSAFTNVFQNGQQIGTADTPPGCGPFIIDANDGIWCGKTPFTTTPIAIYNPSYETIGQVYGTAGGGALLCVPLVCDPETSVGFSPVP
jgi:hypothetical protein